MRSVIPASKFVAVDTNEARNPLLAIPPNRCGTLRHEYPRYRQHSYLVTSVTHSKWRIICLRHKHQLPLFDQCWHRSAVSLCCFSSRLYSAQFYLQLQESSTGLKDGSFPLSSCSTWSEVA